MAMPRTSQTLDVNECFAECRQLLFVYTMAWDLAILPQPIKSYYCIDKNVLVMSLGALVSPFLCSLNSQTI